MDISTTDFLSIGPSGSRRVKFWGDTLSEKKYAHQVLNYQQVINNDFPAITKPTVLRITSPGENFDLKKEFLVLGGYPEAKDFVFKKGLIYPNTCWYQGWQLVLEKVKHFVAQNPLIETMNTPETIQLAFHKLKCQQHLIEQNIQTPKIILEQVIDYESLVQLLIQKNIHQVFIKPYHSSSASGIMAFRQAAGKQVLYTTIDLKKDGLYNNLKIQRYTDVSQIKKIINNMQPSGLHVEEWIRKKTFQQKSVDFRILVINNKAVFVVPRMSQHFITNLHLGNEKGNILSIEKTWGQTIIEQAKTLAVDATKAMKGLFYAGVDVAIAAKGQAYVLEVNAFGDLLLNIEKGNLNTYQYELKEWKSRFL